ncbi:MAG TPA: cytochrome c3 family protein [Anaeromyxobacteraceae bacterium]|jgi:predicted CXXCH cytochrome family protein|nr:cytochrome c3 family protein [Anaeromyxobacteraceae bacterium]
MSRSLLLFFGLAALAAAGVAYALDPPHNATPSLAAITTPIGCTSCHVAHNALGGTLTTDSSQSNLCNSCHAKSTNYGFPWTGSFVQAVPDVGGEHHRWDANAVNPDHDAVSPDPVAFAAMSTRITKNGGKISCSVCHDQHDGATGTGGTGLTQHVSAVNAQLAGGSGQSVVVNTPTMSAPNNSAVPRGYLIQIVVAGAPGTAKYNISHDGGASWFGYSGGWTGVAALGTSPQTTSTTTDTLDDAAVTVKFSGTFVVGDKFAFYISYPLLRYSNDQSKLCLACHPARGQTSACVEGGATTDGAGKSCVADGTRTFSHPVNMAFGAKTTRTLTAGLVKADGTLQTTVNNSDATNIHVGSNTTVQCLSCHYPHNADSNSLTTEQR